MKMTAAAGAILSLAAAIALVVWLSGGSTRSGADATAVEATDPAKDEFPTNPYPKIESGPAPKVEISSTVHEFGLMKVGDKDAHDFVVKNVGDAPLKLAKGPSTCQCTLSELSQLEVAPGESTTITLTWEPKAPDENFRKQATIWTNDPSLWKKSETSFKGEGEIVFTVSGKVFTSVQVEPGDFALGTLDETQPTQVESLVFSRATKDLNVTVDEVSSEFITAEVVEADEKRLEEHDALAGAVVKISIDPRVGVGRVRESVKIKTGDNITPEATINITGYRQGPVTIGGRYWSQAYSMIDFQTFDAEQGAQTTLNIYTPPGDEPAKLEIVEKEPEWLEVSIEEKGREEAVAGAAEDSLRHMHAITVRIPGGRPPERLIGKDAGRLTIRTSLDEVPEIKIRVVSESR